MRIKRKLQIEFERNCFGNGILCGVKIKQIVSCMNTCNYNIKMVFHNCAIVCAIRIANNCWKQKHTFRNAINWPTSMFFLWNFFFKKNNTFKKKFYFLKMTEWDDEFEYPEVWIRNSPKIAPTTFEKDDFVTWNFGKDVNFDYLDWFVKEPKRFAATLQDDLHCMICKRSICDGQWSIETVCGHKYHLDHLRHWYDVCCRKTLKCPECNVNLIKPRDSQKKT